MTVTLDEAVIAQLNQTKFPVEVSDRQGNKVGVYIPLPLENLHATPFTEADIPEAQRIAASTEWVPFVDVWRSWLRLATDPADRARLQQRIQELEEKVGCAGK